MLDLLVTDPQLPSSLIGSAVRIGQELSGFGPAPDESSGAAARRLAGRLGALVEYDWHDWQDRQEFLVRAGSHCRELHDLVSLTYFHYLIT